LAPTAPTLAPTFAPTWSPFEIPGEYGPAEPWNSGNFTSVYVIQEALLNESINTGSPVFAQCMMITSVNGSLTMESVGLRSLTLHLDEVGVAVQREPSHAITFFGMLLRLEFEDFWMSGKLMCDLYLDMAVFEAKLQAFAKYDIFFMVSREEFNSGTDGFTKYIRSKKKVWRNQNDLIDQIYSYTFEETTVDGKPDFTAEAILEDEVTDDSAMLNIEVYPYPTVVNYVSFNRYDYMDWIADIGGYYTIAFGVFFIFSTRITKHANRNDAFQRKQGILPAFSLPHRNAEAISGLRTLVLASLGITEEAYFSGDYDHNFAGKHVN